MSPEPPLEPPRVVALRNLSTTTPTWVVAPGGCSGTTHLPKKNTPGVKPVLSRNYLHLHLHMGTLVPCIPTTPLTHVLLDLVLHKNIYLKFNKMPQRAAKSSKL